MITIPIRASAWMAALHVSLSLSLASPVCAQEVATSFDQLRSLVKPGATVIVTDARGKQTKGKLGELSAGSLELLVPKAESDGRRTFVAQPSRSERDVREVQVEHRDPLWNGILIGSAPGIVLALCGARGYKGDCYYNEPGGEYLFRDIGLIWAALGAPVGVLIDWLRREQVTVYQAPGVRSSDVRILPVLSKSAAGVQMSVRF